MKEGGTREKKPIGEHGWGRLASLLKAFRQEENSLRKRNEDEDKVLYSLKNMSSIGRRGKGRRWRISQQLAEQCMQGSMNDECGTSTGRV